MIKIDDGKIGYAVKKNVESADVVMDASVDPNTFDMLNLARVCPAEKRLSMTVLYSPIEVGRNLARILNDCDGKSVYITGNNIKSLIEFEISEDEVTNWLKTVIAEAMISAKIEKIFSDGKIGVGSAAIKAAAALSIESDGYTA